MNTNGLQIAAAAYKSGVQQDDRRSTIAGARTLVQMNAPVGPQWQGLAQQVFRWGELDLALAALDRWAGQGGTAPAIAYEKAILLSRVGRAADALEKVEKLPADQPNAIANAYLKASLYWNLGRNDDAEREYRRALSVNQAAGAAWLGLAQIGSLSAEDLAAIHRQIETNAFADGTDRAAAHQALAMQAHRAGNHDKAFGHFEQARAAKDARAYSAPDNEASARIASAWDSAAIDRMISLGKDPAEAERPLTIVTGLPRSGTTLVEQILSSHSAVDGGGELGLARQLEAEIGGFAPKDFDAYAAANDASLQKAQALYLRLAAERVPGSQMLVDKSLNQSRSLGPYAALFPQGRFIWLRRDPLENAWSIFRTWMANAAISGWSQEAIAHHMKTEDRLHAHWQAQLGGRLLTVPYEELVAAPEEWIEKITRHAGLDPEEAQSRFYESDGAVSTASAMQVRQPINRKGIGAAEPYREHMKPFLTAYYGPSGAA
ncbi:tetratricopeptide repeat-containing sulfotransferase family protein [Paraurantiacibacter namhicola]|uniref:Sulfotransferase domain protein n=1 Tax=Paraurantiacibacter namhicola TaxID=645517 RepID=A0A1C7D654_9SPHN|nr:sulfotransferase [Paraurantiacibacter namhicola]ANU06811.1 Sulfotransferase domain protein [Paraurantiacibacter namhicola]